MYIQNTYLQPKTKNLKKKKKNLFQGKLDSLNFFVYLQTISVFIFRFIISIIIS